MYRNRIPLLRRNSGRYLSFIEIRHSRFLPVAKPAEVSSAKENGLAILLISYVRPSVSVKMGNCYICNNLTVRFRSFPGIHCLLRAAASRDFLLMKIFREKPDPFFFIVLFPADFTKGFLEKERILLDSVFLVKTKVADPFLFPETFHERE